MHVPVQIKNKPPQLPTKDSAGNNMHDEQEDNYKLFDTGRPEQLYQNFSEHNINADRNNSGKSQQLSHNFSQIAVHANQFIQPKLAVNTAGDEYEQEADAMAEKVMGMPEFSVTPVTAPPAAITQNNSETSGNEEVEEEKKEQEEEKELLAGVPVQRKRIASDEEENKLYETSNVQQVIQSQGESLDQSTRVFMETRFGFDFGKVQIHNNSLAHQSAKDINALAYTHHNHIAFGAGQYQPQTKAGKKLLAHELTHVMQQGGDVIKRVADISNLGTDVSSENENGSSEQAKFIVEDGKTPGDGQKLKSQFLKELNEEICRTVEAALEGTGYTADNCPYIKAAFSKHQYDTPLYIEQLIEKYSGAASIATDAYNMIMLMQVRVADAVKAWLKNKDLSVLPQDIQKEIYETMIDTVKDEIKSKAIEISAPLLKTKDGMTAVRKPGEEILEELGKGQPIESRARNKMENVFDEDFSDVEIHTGGQAAAVSDSMNAKAFATGKHIVFNENQYKPNTVSGDALLAHELAHVQQQKDDDIVNALAGNSGSIYNTLEKEADDKAMSAISKLWKNSGKLLSKFSRQARNAMKGGLHIQSCLGEESHLEILASYSTPITWGGDEFEVTYNLNSRTNTPDSRHFDIYINYAGSDQDDGSEVSFGTTFFGDERIPDPKVEVTADGSLKIDFFNDGSFIVLLSDDVTLGNQWTPPTKTHKFTGDLGGKKHTAVNTITVKPLDSVPTPVGTIPDDLLVQPVQTSVKDPLGAVELAKTRLDELVAENIFKDNMKDGLVLLQKQLETDIAAIKSKGTSLTTAEKESYIAKANSLEDSLRDDAAILKNLAAIAIPELYLEDISAKAIAFVDEVRNEFELTIFFAYESAKEALASRKTGTDLLFKLPYKISGLYIARGRAIEGLAIKMTEMKGHISIYRSMSGKNTDHTRDIDTYLEYKDPMGVIYNKGGQLRDKFLKDAGGVLDELLKLTIDSKRYLAVYSIIALYEQFYFFDKEIPWLTSSSSTRKKVTVIRDKLKAQVDRIEPTLAPGKPMADFEKAMETATTEYLSIVTDKDFDSLLHTIQEDFQDWEKIKFVGKAIVIIAAAAFTAGEAGLAMGAALETASIGGAVAFGAVAFAEALAFTATSRLVGSALFGIKPTESFGSELITNWLMFGYLKKFEQMYRMMTIAMELRGMSKAASIASKGITKGAFTLGALQLFSWVHETAKGKSMTAGQFAESTVFNAVIMGVLHVGKFMFTPAESRFEADIRAEINKNYSVQFAELEKARASLKTIMDDLAAKKITDPAKAIEALGKIKEISAAEMELQLKAAKAIGKTGDGLKAISEKYTRIIEEADLMLATKGVVSQSGGELFVQVKTGTLLFEDGKLASVKDILEAFYKEIGGTVEYKNGIFYGKSGAETTLFIPESKAIEMSLPNLLEPRRQALEIVGEFDTKLPQMEKFKDFRDLKPRIERLVKDFEAAKKLINGEPANALTKLEALKTKMTELKKVGEAIEDAKIIAGTSPTNYTYRWGGTGKLETGLRGLEAIVTKTPDAATGLKTTTATMPDGTVIIFTERPMPASYGGKEVIIDPANTDIQKVFTDFSITDAAARREIMRRLEVSMSANGENLPKSLIEVKTYLTGLQSKSSTSGTVEKQLLDVAAKGRVASEMHPDILTKAADLEAQGILKSKQFRDARTTQEYEGTVAEYLAQKDIASASTTAGKTVYRNVRIIGDMFADAAGTKPYVRSSGGGSTNIDVVPEIDSISGTTSKSVFEVTDIYNVKAGRGLDNARKQNDTAEKALQSLENNSIIEITTNDGKTAFIKVKTVNALDAAGNVVDLTSQLKLSPSGVSKVTYGASTKAGFDKAISTNPKEISDIAKVLRERLLMSMPHY